MKTAVKRMMIGERIRPGEHVEYLAERFALAAYPRDHDAGRQNARHRARHLIAGDEVVYHFRESVVRKPACHRRKCDREYDLGPLLAQYEGEPGQAGYIRAAGVADKVAHAHDVGKMSEENEVKRQHAAADGIVGKAGFRFALLPERNDHEARAQSDCDNPHPCSG